MRARSDSRPAIVPIALTATAILSFLLWADLRPAARAQGPRSVGALTLSSPAFEAGRAIPAPYTCTGAGRSVPLVIDGVPDGARSLALIVDDPDAPKGGFTHWLVYNLPPSTRRIQAGASGGGLPAGAVEGRSDSGRVGYAPPCPPRGRHHYVFTLYALDAQLPSLGAVSRQRLEAALDRHILERATLVGTYAR